MISILRRAGIPARYVVGMMKGEGFSHAWVEAVISGVWVGFDPTNDNLVDDTYIKISSGRDYQDCIVNRGFFNGCVTQKQNIKVVVREV
jgi:transglutaminase-like putative cysteine protease